MGKHVHVHLGPGRTADADDGGRWVTINGTHVQIGKGGKITKGPAALKGKTQAEAHQHAGAEHLKAHDEAKKKGDADLAKKHLEASAAHTNAGEHYKQGSSEAGDHYAKKAQKAEGAVEGAKSAAGIRGGREAVLDKGKGAHVTTQQMARLSFPDEAHQKQIGALKSGQSVVIKDAGRTYRVDRTGGLVGIERDDYDQAHGGGHAGSGKGTVMHGDFAEHNYPAHHKALAGLKEGASMDALHRSGVEHTLTKRGKAYEVHKKGAAPAPSAPPAGPAPGKKSKLAFKSVEEAKAALGGKAAQQIEQKAGSAPAAAEKKDNVVQMQPGKGKPVAPSNQVADAHSKAAASERAAAKHDTSDKVKALREQKAKLHEQVASAPDKHPGGHAVYGQIRQLESDIQKAKTLKQANGVDMQGKAGPNPLLKKSQTQSLHEAAAATHEAHAAVAEKSGDSQLASMHKELAGHHSHMAANPKDDHSARGAKVQALRQDVAAHEKSKAKEAAKPPGKEPAPGKAPGKAPSGPAKASGGSSGVQGATEAVKGLKDLVKKAGEASDPDPKKQD